MWIELGIGSAVLLGFYDVFRKASLGRNAVLPVLWLSTVAAAAPFAALWVASRLAPAALPAGCSVPEAPLAVHGLLLVKALLVGSSWILEFFALKHLPISTAAPIRASQPVFTTTAAVLWMGERMSAGRWAGLALTLGSYLLFSFAGRRQDGARMRGWILCAVMGTLVGAGCAIYDKFLLRSIDPMTVQAYYTIYIAAIMGGVVLLLWRPSRHRTTPFRWRWTIPLVGLFLAASDTLYFHALAMPGALIAILAAVRRANVIIAFAAGAWVFKEQRTGAKAIALAGILAGVTIMTLA